MKYTHEEYLELDPFQGDEGELSCHTVKIVKVRKEHKCLFGLNGDNHTIKPGEYARFEKALVDGDYFGSYYFCTRCMDNMIDEGTG